MGAYIDRASAVVILITLILFVVALFVKGLTQDMLLEAAVFLVSVKLILMAYQNQQQSRQLQEELAELKTLLADRQPS